MTSLSNTRLGLVLFLAFLVTVPSCTRAENDDDGGNEQEHQPCSPGSNCPQHDDHDHPIMQPPPPSKQAGGSAPAGPAPVPPASWKVKTIWSIGVPSAQFDAVKHDAFIAAMSSLTGVQASDIVVQVMSSGSARRLLQASPTTLACIIQVSDQSTAEAVANMISTDSLAPFLAKASLPAATMLASTIASPPTPLSGAQVQPFNGPVGNPRSSVTVDQVKNAGIAFGILYVLCLLCAGLPTNYTSRDHKPRLAMVAVIALWTLILARAVFFFVDPFHARGTFCLSLMFTLYGIYFPLVVLLKIAHCSIHGYLNRSVTVVSLLLFIAEFALQIASDIYKGKHPQSTFERAPAVAFIILGMTYSVSAFIVSTQEKKIFLSFSAVATFVVVVFNILEEAKVYHLLDKLPTFVIYSLLELLVVFFDGMALRQWLNSRDSFPVGVVEGSVDPKKMNVGNFVYPSAPEVGTSKSNMFISDPMPVKGICEDQWATPAKEVSQDTWEPFSNELPADFTNRLQVVVDTASISSGGTSRPPTGVNRYPILASSNEAPKDGKE